jgi:hypothetical protein
MTERPAISVFYKDADGAVFHKYSCYARGLDMLNVAYHYLDLTAIGRDEAGLPFPMACALSRCLCRIRSDAMNYRRVRRGWRGFWRGRARILDQRSRDKATEPRKGLILLSAGRGFLVTGSGLA